MIDLVVPEGRFTETEMEDLGARLTSLIIEWESGTDIAGYEQAAWAWVHEARQVLVAGRRRDETALPLYKVIATVPKGSLDERRRAGLIGDVTDAIISTEGRVPSDRDRQRVWCIIDEVPDGNWGAGGHVVRLRDLAAGFGVTPDHPRWVDLRFDQR
jgi:phenylpyruvate tautomerase PptA (4-oxalocrotonate tautomerase family)